MNVRLSPDGKYRGPYGPDPSKSREQREAELRRLVGGETGFDILVALTHEAMGVPMGTMLPPGMLASQMIEAILKHEYPEKKE